MTDVPVCAGRGSQPRCKYCRMNGSEPAVYWCTALYNVVTGEALLRACGEVRGDQMACGRHGALYEPAEVSIRPQRVTVREDLG